MFSVYNNFNVDYLNVVRNLPWARYKMVTVTVYQEGKKFA